MSYVILYLCLYAINTYLTLFIYAINTYLTLLIYAINTYLTLFLTPVFIYISRLRKRTPRSVFLLQVLNPFIYALNTY
jgi:hypothetical protein